MSNGRMLQHQERGRGHNSTRSRRILPYSPRRSGRNRSIRRGGGATTVPDPVGSHPLPFVKAGETAVSRGREGSQAYQAPENHTLHFDVQTGEPCSIQRKGGGTTVPDPVGPYPRPSCQTGECCSIKREGEGTTVPDPVGSYPIPLVEAGETAVSGEGEGLQQYQTP